jgi:hypothetical protein
VRGGEEKGGERGGEERRGDYKPLNYPIGFHKLIFFLMTKHFWLTGQSYKLW